MKFFTLELFLVQIFLITYSTSFPHGAPECESKKQHGSDEDRGNKHDRIDKQMSSKTGMVSTKIEMNSAITQSETEMQRTQIETSSATSAEIHATSMKEESLNFQSEMNVEEHNSRATQATTSSSVNTMTHESESRLSLSSANASYHQQGAAGQQIAIGRTDHQSNITDTTTSSTMAATTSESISATGSASFQEKSMTQQQMAMSGDKQSMTGKKVSATASESFQQQIAVGESGQFTSDSSRMNSNTSGTMSTTVNGFSQQHTMGQQQRSVSGGNQPTTVSSQINSMAGERVSQTTSASFQQQSGGQSTSASTRMEPMTSGDVSATASGISKQHGVGQHMSIDRSNQSMVRDTTINSGMNSGGSEASVNFSQRTTNMGASERAEARMSTSDRLVQNQNMDYGEQGHSEYASNGYTAQGSMELYENSQMSYQDDYETAFGRGGVTKSNPSGYNMGSMGMRAGSVQQRHAASPQGIMQQSANSNLWAKKDSVMSGEDTIVKKVVIGGLSLIGL